MIEHAKGFTLIELMVVVAILGVLVAIAIPAFEGSKATASDAAAKADVKAALASLVAASQ